VITLEKRVNYDNLVITHSTTPLPLYKAREIRI